MAGNNLRALTDKLNETCLKSLEGAAGLCLSKTNFNVEMEHWLLKLLDVAESDLSVILRHYDIDKGRVRGELTRAMEGFKTGNGRAPQLSPDIAEMIRQSWLLATIDMGAGRIRSGHLLAALLSDRDLSLRIRNNSPELNKISSEKLSADLATLLAHSKEDPGTPAQVASGSASAAAGPDGKPVAGSSKTPSLDQFTQDLTARAREGKIDPVIGRDFEIRQVIDILTRRRQNNPILAGEAGVGKTAVVEGFALRIAAGDVPEPLRGVSLRSLDLGLLQAGAGVKGEFENRLKSVIQEVQGSATPIILFIDEAHTLIGAGGAAGAGDAANLLKPALARGELRTVAATTFDEYKKSFEDDPALKRRFQLVKVDEPDRDKAVAMLRGVVPSLEKHHKVRILDDAVVEAVRLSQRYIPDRQLPDKGISLLDTACARVALSQSTTPAALEDSRREVDKLKVAKASLEREENLGIAHKAQLAEIEERLAREIKRGEELAAQWEKEKVLAGKVEKLADELAPVAGPKAKEEAPGATATQPADPAKARADLQALSADLHQVQGETPLVHPFVDNSVVADVISGWTGIPLGKMVRNEVENVLHLAETLKKRVVGQDHAMDILAERIQTNRAGLSDPRLPIGVFMLVGPSGTGKTETALALAELMFGGENSITVINMSEYKSDMMVSRLTGPAPGLVGYGKGGVLTEAVRRKPSSLVLLDEIEKANPAVHDLFFQVFDKGSLTDEKGLETDFKNTIILLTSNAGTDLILKLCADPDTRPDSNALRDAIRPELLKSFKDAFLGRITVVPYFPLAEEVLRKIIGLKLGKVADRLKESYRAAFEYDEAVVKAILGRCNEAESGARIVDKIINTTLLPEISRRLLTTVAEGGTVGKVRLGAGKDGQLYEITVESTQAE